MNKVLFADYDRYLDQVTQIDWLRDPRVASIVRENLNHHDGERYLLHAYCIMPNHVHLLLTPHEPHQADAVGETPDGKSPLSSIMHSLKSYTANRVNQVLERTGRLWHPESYDHWVRDDEELERIVNYIRGNPVSAGLVGCPEESFWSSCHDRFLLDGDTSGWLPVRNTGCQPVDVPRPSAQ